MLGPACRSIHGTGFAPLGAQRQDEKCCGFRSLGSTETAPFALAITEVQEKSGNIGVPARGLTLKLVPTSGKLELRLKGRPFFLAGYGDPKRTAEARLMRTASSAWEMPCVQPIRMISPKGSSLMAGLVKISNLRLAPGSLLGLFGQVLLDAMQGLIRDAVIVGENESRLGALADTILMLDGQWTGMALHKAIQTHLETAAGAATGSASRVRLAPVLYRDPNFDKVTDGKGSLNQQAAMRANNADAIASLYSDNLYSVPSALVPLIGR